jgi:hypothetical protein
MELVAVMVRLPADATGAVGRNTTPMLHATPAAVPAAQLLASVAYVDDSANAPEKVRLAGGIGSSAVIASGVRVTIWAALVAPTNTAPKFGGGVTVAVFCPNAAAAKRRTPATRAGTLQIELGR